ncbi:EAP30/Vps36 family-domain-containing protein [Radiomyces spectabilis]|uniref:EAP30/Vps36 family-domain-containing protein n=1 Tax=Radiomyces spectabilis TaxID=64574 RepID=UPI0022206710|nr:EAP30/Vps36 family-domain-containing protein [Radiomyces spectabilis]KAI8369426.1 EAP30/Vps36 family-domain-containing protein [Radiomyces spectabilis]
MRRRPVGLAHAQHRERLDRDFQQVGDSIAARELEQLQQQLEVFKNNLEEFAWKHRKDIRKDATFRAHFQRMCANIGVDPLASNKGFWADLLGVGDFYYELGIQIIEGCMASRSRDGGLTELGDLKRRVERMRGGAKSGKHTEITEDDIIRAIKTLKPLSGGFEVISIGSRKMVRSVPKELDKDQSSLLLLAQNKGYVMLSMVQQELGWEQIRTNNALEHLLQDGLAWVDTQGDENLYWISSYFHLEIKPTE